MKHLWTICLLGLTLAFQNCASPIAMRGKTYKPTSIAKTAKAEHQEPYQHFVKKGKNGEITLVKPTKKPKSVDRLIIYNAYMQLVHDQPDSDSLKSFFMQLAKKYEGYVLNINSSRVKLRVPSQDMRGAIQDLSAIGKVKDKSITTQDVTSDFYDRTIRLENAQKTRARYLKLLDKAQNVEEILKVEKELERLNATIDLLKGQLNKYSHLVTYSTINVHLNLRDKPGVLSYPLIGLYKGVRWLFVRN
ncbi:MAG TPA: hypothetical protein DCS93_37945 [Microscillaceae bacterium]|nr:hypothetical protein [Microscillaceae bacterium]